MRNATHPLCALLLAFAPLTAYAGVVAEPEAEQPEADQAEGDAPTGDAPAAPASTDGAQAKKPIPRCESKDPTTAEVNSREGVRLAKGGKYREAVPLFRMATRLDGCAPDHLLLLARALARSNELDEARTHYRAVIERFPTSQAARRAETELATLEAGGAVGASETPVPVESRWPIIGGMTAAAGALVVVGGALFALDAQGADDDLVTAARTPDRSAYNDLVDRRERSSTLAYALYGVGGAALIAGGVLFFAGDSIFGGTGPKAVVAPTPGGGGVFGLSGQF